MVVAERQAGEKGKAKKLGKRNAVPNHSYLIYLRRGVSTDDKIFALRLCNVTLVYGITCINYA